MSSIDFIIQKNSASFPSSPTTFPLTIGSNNNRILRVFIGLGTTGITSITFNGAFLTREGNYTFSGGPYGSLWTLIAPDTGTHDLVITHGGGDTFTATIISAYDVDQASPGAIVSDVTGVFGVSSTPSLPVTSDATSLIIGIACIQYATRGSD